jgi:hypothetical protein
MKKIKVCFVCFLVISVFNLVAESPTTQEDRSKMFSIETDLETLLFFAERHTRHLNIGLIFPIDKIKMNFKFNYIYSYYKRISEVNKGHVEMFNQFHDLNLGPIWHLKNYMYAGILLGGGHEIWQKNSYSSIRLSPVLSFTTDREKRLFFSLIFKLKFQHIFLLKGQLSNHVKPMWNPFPLSTELTAGITF